MFGKIGETKKISFHAIRTGEGPCHYCVTLISLTINGEHQIELHRKSKNQNIVTSVR